MAYGGQRTSSTSSNAGENCIIFVKMGTCCADKLYNSLEKQPDRRATPWRMLEHPWMVEMKTKRVNMTQFLKTVWDWQDE